MQKTEKVYKYKFRYLNDIHQATLSELVSFGEPHAILVMLPGGMWVWFSDYLKTLNQ